MKAPVSLIIPIYGGNILLQKRPEGRWGLFGGHRRYKENEKTCACREFIEETGVKIRPNILKKLGTLGRLSYFVLKANRKFNVYKNQETKSHRWVHPSELKRMKLHPEFRKSLSQFYKLLSKMEESMQSTKINASTYGDIVATLGKAGRHDLVIAMAGDMQNVTINKESQNILHEKASKLIEAIERDCEKIAEGPVECDLLKKHIVKMLQDKYGEVEAPVEAEDDTEMPTEDDSGEEIGAPTEEDAEEV